jgi:hypothetical protein
MLIVMEPSAQQNWDIELCGRLFSNKSAEFPRQSVRGVKTVFSSSQIHPRPKKGLLVLLTMGFQMMAIMIASGQTSTTVQEPAVAQSISARIYPLRFDPGAFDVRQFVSMANGQPAILAYKKTAPIMMLDEFLSNRRILIHALEQDAFNRTGASVVGPSTLDRQGLYGVSLYLFPGGRWCIIYHSGPAG